ncbi:maleylpyruvate isomerase N-terminal domain-containing protein [Nonomuraea ferruginea]
MEPLERLYLDALLEEPAEPKGSLRPQLLAGARARRRPAAPTAPWAEPYAGRVAAMDALLAAAVDDDWSRVIVEGWTLQELVAHLAAKDGLVAAGVGAPVLGPELAAADALGRTADVQAYERARSPEQTRRDWRAQADALCRHLATVPPGTTASVDGLTVPVRDHVLARMLETWIHTDDAARVARRPAAGARPRARPPDGRPVRPAAAVDDAAVRARRVRAQRAGDAHRSGRRRVARGAGRRGRPRVRSPGRADHRGRGRVLLPAGRPGRP